MIYILILVLYFILFLANNKLTNVTVSKLKDLYIDDLRKFGSVSCNITENPYSRRHRMLTVGSQ